MFKQIILFTSLFHALPDFPQISLLPLWTSDIPPRSPWPPLSLDTCTLALTLTFVIFPSSFLCSCLSPLQTSPELLAAPLLRFFGVSDVSFSCLHLSGPRATHPLTRGARHNSRTLILFPPAKARSVWVSAQLVCHETFLKLKPLRFHLPCFTETG